MSASKQEKLTSLFKSARVVPVLTINRLEDAVPLARALVSGGVRMLEVTLRTEVAIEAAKAIIANVPDAIVGIGTILNGDDLARAEELGARFGISPGATPELLKAAAASSLPFAPGIATASELICALTTTIGTGLISIMVLVASMPSTFGMLTSIVMTSGLFRLTNSMAS